MPEPDLARTLAVLLAAIAASAWYVASLGVMRRRPRRLRLLADDGELRRPLDGLSLRWVLGPRAGYERPQDPAASEKAVVAVVAGIAVTCGSLLLRGATVPRVAGAFSAGLAVGWSLPAILVEHRRRSRLKEVARSLPEVIDLMLVCTDSGMNLHTALRYVARVTGGPLGSDLRCVVASMGTGKALNQALRGMCEGDSTPQIRSFVSALCLSHVKGNPVSGALRAQAWMAGQQRRHALDTAVRSMPAKISVCAILFLMPPIFVITVLPSVLIFLGSRW